MNRWTDDDNCENGKLHKNEIKNGGRLMYWWNINQSHQCWTWMY
jgi:hypothetical protein